MIIKSRFRIKLTATLIGLTLTVSTLTIFLVYRKSLREHKEELRNKLTAIVSTGALMIDSQKHSQIPLNRAGVDTPQYKEAQSILRHIRDANPGIRYVYTAVKTDNPNVLKFIVDADEDPNLISYPGDDYDVTRSPQMKAAFDKPVADYELTADKWGIWLSAYAPIKDEKNNTIAILGIDMSAKKFAEAQAGIHRGAALALLISTLLSFAIGMLLAKAVTEPLTRLVNGTRRVAAGDFSKAVDIKTKDEIEELANSFNSMMGELKGLYKALQEHFLYTVYALVEAIEAKDPYTRGHSERVAKYAVGIAQGLGLSGEQISIMKNIAVLHDIGKIGISETILNKPSKLTDEEWAIVKNHPVIGESILHSLEQLQPGLAIVKYHHERYDGNGYPEGLKEKQIPLLASIVAVADAFDAMTSVRPYRKALGVDEAVAQLKECSGKQFDPSVVNAFLDILKEEPPSEA